MERRRATKRPEKSFHRQTEFQQSQKSRGPGSRQIRRFVSAATTNPSSFPFPRVSSCRNELRTATTQGLAVAMKQCRNCVWHDLQGHGSNSIKIDHVLFRACHTKEHRVGA